MLAVRRERETCDGPRAVGVTEGIQIIKKPGLHFQVFHQSRRRIKQGAQLIRRRCPVAAGPARVRAWKQVEWSALRDVPKVNAIITPGNQRAPVGGEHETVGRAREVGERKRLLAARPLPQHAPFEAAQIHGRSSRRKEALISLGLSLVTSVAAKRWRSDALRHAEFFIRNSPRPVFVQEPASQRQIIHRQRLERGVDVRRIGPLLGGTFPSFSACGRRPGLAFLGDGDVALALKLLTADEQQDDEADDGRHADGDQPGTGRVTPRPFDHAFAHRDGTRLNRLVPEPAFQIFGQRLGRGVALRGLFLQALEADRFQIAVHFLRGSRREEALILCLRTRGMAGSLSLLTLAATSKAAWWHRLFLHDHSHRGQCRVGLERGLAG